MGVRAPGTLELGRRQAGDWPMVPQFLHPSGGTPDDDFKSVAEVKVRRISGRGVGGVDSLPALPCCTGFTQEYGTHSLPQRWEDHCRINVSGSARPLGAEEPHLVSTQDGAQLGLAFSKTQFPTLSWRWSLRQMEELQLCSQQAPHRCRAALSGAGSLPIPWAAPRLAGHRRLIDRPRPPAPWARSMLKLLQAF